ncbi:MAG: 2-deoxyribose-5-phosphate aldolase, partial [Clostridia bacterium]|nr:2-deoxyribose-5-phosphate aldolase [Clostridia bacterium]
MEIKEILARCDHTLLRPTAVWAEIRDLCDDGIRFKTASVCIPASYVRRAAEYAEGRIPICTVIGFPNGYDTTEAKVFMVKDAV